MNLSRKWLNEFVQIDASDREFAEALTLSGSKVEVTYDLSAEISNVVVAKVLSMKKHENSDHMWVCMVDIGKDDLCADTQRISHGGDECDRRHDDFITGADSGKFIGNFHAAGPVVEETAGAPLLRDVHLVHVER